METNTKTEDIPPEQLEDLNEIMAEFRRNDDIVKTSVAIAQWMKRNNIEN